jgi:hypothetical protein
MDLLDQSYSDRKVTAVQYTVYGNYIHQKDGSHLDGGIPDDAAVAEGGALLARKIGSTS